MPEFLSIPAFRIERPDKWVLEGELVYRSDLWPSTIVVPKGFVTDLASIPRIFRSIIPQNGKHRAPAVVHDYLCRGHEKFMPRSLADKIFLEAMKLEEVSFLKRWAMYVFVSAVTLWLRKP